MPTKTAAVRPDKLGDTTLEKLTAAQFVEALQDRQAFELTRYWPEKKKYELELEPGALGKIRLKDFIGIVDRIRGEKKKVEYEIPDWWRWRINPDPTQLEPGLDRSIGGQLDQLAGQIRGLSERVEQLGRR